MEIKCGREERIEMVLVVLLSYLSIGLNKLLIIIDRLFKSILCILPLLLETRKSNDEEYKR